MRAIRWAVLNGVFAGMLWFGLVEGMQGAKNVGLFMAWMTSVFSIFALTEEGAAAVAKHERSVPAVFDVCFDMAIAGLLVWFGAWATGIAYTIQIVILAGVRARNESAKAATQ